jgi:hypothetical protein
VNIPVHTYLILARPVVVPACILRDVIFIGNVKSAILVLNLDVISLLVRLLGGVHYMLKDTM